MQRRCMRLVRKCLGQPLHLLRAYAAATGKALIKWQDGPVQAALRQWLHAVTPKSDVRLAVDIDHRVL